MKQILGRSISWEHEKQMGGSWTMKLSVRSWNYLQVAALCLAVCAVAGMGAAKKPRLKAGQFNPDNETVEFFSAMDSGEIKVRFIPRDSTEATVTIENK